MNKSFVIAVIMLITSSTFFSLMANDVIRGIGIGTMISIVTFIYFEFEFFDTKKD